LSWIIVAFWIVAIASPVIAFAVWLISRVINVNTEITQELRAKVIEIANMCPVYRTLKPSAVVVTSVDTRSEAAPRAVLELSGPDGEIRSNALFEGLGSDCAALRGL
jgi:hypothetical protein